MDQYLIVFNVLEGPRNTENMLNYLCKTENKVIRSSSRIMTVVMTTAENADRGMIVAVRLGKVFIADKLRPGCRYSC